MPKALYVHSSSHRLNLAIAKTCGIQTVKNMLSHAQTISSVSSPSPKCTQLLKKKMKEISSKAAQAWGSFYDAVGRKDNQFRVC